MISTSDRQQAIQLIDEARTAGSKLRTACVALVVGTNTYFLGVVVPHLQVPDRLLN
ncbi:MAG: hypothetical protein ACTJG4_07630 [Vreelandella alkaliphila]|uniref:hypothetical protein n=1 Tax=Halomonadaceae TaxID=28256 RepID=UPI00186906FA|nr:MULTISPECIES: hypothetical protein [unclassified Halomonas]